MGAGISKERERRLKYSGLHRIMRELRKAGVECQYGNKAVTGGGFRVSYGETIRASNGECFGNLHVQVDGRDYWFLESNKGLARIKAVYGGERDQLAVTELAWLIVRVERAVKHDRPVFLHNDDGSLFKTFSAGGMKPGQLYAYNEMHGDRPMLRIGPSHDYTEFLPGMSVRDGNGNVLVEREPAEQTASD